MSLKACKNDPSKKYRGTEPSPKGLGWCAHAEETGEVRAGLNGKKWVVKQDKNGTKSWKPSVSSSVVASPQKVYWTHDNGGRPFMVSFGGGMVSVQKMHPDEDEYEVRLLSERLRRERYSQWVVRPTKYVKAFVGEDLTHKGNTGNSMLFDLGAGVYLYVGEAVWTFEPGEKITRFVSPVGNSDTSSPYAVSAKGSYLMLEKIYMPHADKAWEDPYEALYAMNSRKANKYRTAHGIRVKKSISTRLI